MSKSLVKRLKTSIFGIGMTASIVIGTIMLLWRDIINNINYISKFGSIELGGMFLENFDFAVSHSTFSIFAPILAALPSAIMFCEDYNSGYIRNILVKKKKKEYIKETLICSTVSGGLAIFIPMFILMLYCLITGELNVQGASQFDTLLSGTIFDNIQYIWNGLFVAIVFLILAFLFGAVWSNFSLMVSSIKPNRYVSLVAPFSIYYFLHLIFYRMGDLVIFSPLTMLLPTVVFLPNMFYPCIYQIVILVGASVVFSILAKRRLKDV